MNCCIELIELKWQSFWNWNGQVFNYIVALNSLSSNGKLNKTIYYYLHTNYNISILHLYFDYSTSAIHHMKIQKCELLGEHLYFILDEGVKHCITHHIFLHLVSFVILAIKIFQMHLKGLLLKLGVIIVIVQLNNVDIVHGIHMDLVIFILLWPWWSTWILMFVSSWLLYYWGMSLW